ncbi:hypothetical protein CYLTODRAFT_455560 [Cylindrobasidium torrendii FP15055 ss-10]|uniref:Uncharacterized protein n=1 Tax=Cylindrobasidium torrendii FP15055 ss-10 TaxID=1314674 RepID=A0A0D7B6U9_9AGAR|nr:hypothetical protein CYLTODRAFT_455560 [Cylindrobasidium torrendii FP15055 ss-10]
MPPATKFDFIAYLRRWTEIRYGLKVGNRPIYAESPKYDAPRPTIPIIMDAILHFASLDSSMSTANMYEMPPDALYYTRFIAA